MTAAPCPIPAVLGAAYAHALDALLALYRLAECRPGLSWEPEYLEAQAALRAALDALRDAL